jgi:hypothetical protein
MVRRLWQLSLFDSEMIKLTLQISNKTTCILNCNAKGTHSNNAYESQDTHTNPNRVNGKGDDED